MSGTSIDEAPTPTSSGNREEEMDVDRSFHARFLHCLECGQHHGNPGLVVEVAGNNIPVFYEFRLRMNGNNVPDINLQTVQVVDVSGKGINAQFHIVP